jgi:hypothetical protein
MIEYSRIKSVGVQKQRDGRRVISGVLEDELYAMQCEIAVSWPEMIIESVKARMKRFTTHRCLLASPVFSRAQGWKVNPQVDSKIKKELGREGCRHMAALMIECLHTMARAEFAGELRSALSREPELDKKKFFQEFISNETALTAYLKAIMS